MLSFVEGYRELVKRLVAAIEVQVKEAQARLEASDRMMRRADELMAYRPVWPAPAGPVTRITREDQDARDDREEP